VKEVLESNAKIVRKVCAPRKYPCPTCGKKGRRQFIKSRFVRHLAPTQPLYWEVVIGVYKARCQCCKFFSSTVEGVEPSADYTNAVREKVVNLLVRDQLSGYGVQRHLEEDFLLHVSIGYVHNCLDLAKKKSMNQVTGSGS
jgi:transposase